jgi:hypothetical protein
VLRTERKHGLLPHGPHVQPAWGQAEGMAIISDQRLSGALELNLRGGRGPWGGLVPYMRTVKTTSGATAVQVVWSSRRGSRELLSGSTWT